jgi:hypothetical protein
MNLIEHVVIIAILAASAVTLAVMAIVGVARKYIGHH